MPSFEISVECDPCDLCGSHTAITVMCGGCKRDVGWFEDRSSVSSTEIEQAFAGHSC